MEKCGKTGESEKNTIITPAPVNQFTTPIAKLYKFGKLRMHARTHARTHATHLHPTPTLVYHFGVASLPRDAVPDHLWFNS